MKRPFENNFDLLRQTYLETGSNNINSMKNISLTNKHIFSAFRWMLMLSLFMITKGMQAQDFGKSLDFDGVDDHLVLSGFNDFGKLEHWDDAYSIEFWMQDNGSQDGAKVLDIGSDSSRLSVAPNSSSGILEVVVNNSSMSVVNPLTAGWNHIAITVNSLNNSTLYINGIQERNTSLPDLSSGGAFTTNYIAKSFDSNPYFKGKVDEVRFWSKQLTQVEIADRMHCELAGDEDDLIAYFKLNGGIGDGYNGGYYGETQATNFGNLSSAAAGLSGFSLNGTSSNWSSDSGINTDQVNQNSVEFDGHQDWFEIDNATQMDLSDGFTIQMWINPSETSSEILFNRSIYQDVVIGIVNDHLVFTTLSTSNFGNNTVSHNSEVFIEKNKWQHVTFRAKQFAFPNLKIESDIFLNGVLVSSKSGNNLQIRQVPHPIRIGRDYKGRLSNLQVWDRPLTELEIEESKSQFLPQGTSNLLAQYATYSDFSQGLVDHIGGQNATRRYNPVFAADPCFVQFGETPEDVVVDALGDDVSLDLEIESCSDDRYNYQWFFNDQEIVGATGKILNITNSDFDDFGLYSLQVTACGTVYHSEDFRVSLKDEGIVLKFDGVDDYVTFSSNLNSNNYTIETWVRFDSDPANQSILFLSNDSGPNDYYTKQLRVNEDGYFEHSTFNGVDASTVRHPIKPIVNKWYHLSGKTVGGMMSISVDNVIGETETSGNPTGGNIWYLGHPVSGHDALDGELADLRIWNTDKNTYAEEFILSNDPNLSNLIHYFTFNEGLSGSDNTMPLKNTINPTFTTEIATLYNFDLKGTNSNWMGCDPYNTGHLLSVVPQSDIYNYEDEMTLSVEVVNNPANVTFQWFKDDMPIDGATNSTYTVASMQPKDDGIYYVRVSDPILCDVYSPRATIAVEGPGEVLAFDGVDDYLEIQTTPLDEYTIEMWVKFDDVVASQNIISGTNVNVVGTLSHQLYTNEDGYFCHYTFTNTSHNQVSTVQAEPNTWYHVAIRASSESGLDISMVIDGQVASSSLVASTILWQGLNTYYVGKSSNSVIGRLDPFKGQMDALHIHNSWVDIADFQTNRFVEKKYDVGLHHSFLFNTGFPDADNTDIISDGIVDYGNAYQNLVEKGNATMYNFAKSGSTSNWSGCSPAQVPSVFVESNQNNASFHLGQHAILAATSSNTTSLFGIDLQWKKDGVEIEGATNSTLEFDPFTADDVASYSLIYSEDCADIQETEIDYGLVNLICYSDVVLDTIETENQTVYAGSTGPENDNKMNDIHSGYCGTANDYIGAEVSYYWNVDEPMTVSLNLSMISVDHDIWVFTDDCDIRNCVASSNADSLLDENLLVDLDIGEYYIVIDTKNDFFDFGDSYTLEVSVFDSKCENATEVFCGDLVSGTTVGQTDLITDYCGHTGYDNTEQIYSIDITAATTLELSLTGMAEDLDLFLLDSTCRDNVCLANSINGIGEDESIKQAVTPGTYYIVIDGKNGTTGSFDLSINCQDYFETSFDDNDAYIDLDWSIDAATCVPQDTGVIVRIITQFNQILFEEEYTTAAMAPDLIQGTHRHFVGPNVTLAYRLKVINRLSGVTICNELKTGKTLPFQEPEIISISQGDAPHKVAISWRNHSKLSDNYRVLRDGVQIATLLDGYTEDSLIINYVDEHDINDQSSLQDAQTSTYSIRAFSTNFFESYTDVDTVGSTYDIQFAATDLTYEDKVEMTWNDVSAHCNRVKIERNGIIQDIISSANTMYVDIKPIHGEVVTYSLTMMQDAVEIMEVEDEGSAPANGKIEGSVVTSGVGLPVRDVAVTLARIITGNGTQVLDTIGQTATDFLGRYTFDYISYGLADDFQVSISKTGFTFDSTIEEVSLNSAIPIIQGVNFEQVEDIVLDSVVTFIDTLYSEASESLGLVDIYWDYAYPMSTPITFFLFRDGDLIFESDDSNGKISTFRDITGVPNATYNYTLQAFSEDGTTTTFQSKITPSTYPEIPSMNGFDFELGHFSDSEEEGEGFQSLVSESGQSIHNSSIQFSYNSSHFDASYSQINADGLRIFRNGRLIRELDLGTTAINYLAPPDIEAGYSIRLYRKIGEASYESEKYPSEDTLITSLPLFPVSLDFSLPGGINNENSDDEARMSSNSTGLTGERVILANYVKIDMYGNPEFINLSEALTGFSFDGVRIERKLSGDPDSTYFVVDNLAKNFMISQASGSAIPAMYDTYALPGLSYDYRVSSYLEVEGQEYFRDTTFTRFIDDIRGPQNLSKTEDFGKVTLNWDDNSEFIDFSYLYINYDGVMVRRRNLNTGSDWDTLAYLDQKAEHYIDYISNRQFNIFLNDYETINYEYAVSSFIEVDGEKYYSQPLTINAKPLNDSEVEPVPTNLMASDNLPDHVKLCWEWEASKQSEFVIFRGDTPIDTLPWTARAYYDYGAPSSSEIEYQVASYFEGVLSAKAKAMGGILNENSVITMRGRVFDIATGVGVPDVLVRNGYVITGSYSDLHEGTTRTDSTGYFVFKDVPKREGRSMWLRVSSNEVTFPDGNGSENAFDSELFGIGEANEYVFNFESNLIIPASTDRAIIADIVATPSAPNRNVAIRWSPTNGVYDGFEVRRANVLIATVPKGQGLEVIDSTGFPGEQYGYGVRAYYGPEGDREYSAYKVTGAIFPSIVSPENLTATPYIEDNLMQIAWSHPLNDHDFYRVTRDGQLKAVIPTSEPQMWYDSTGVPGRSYQYQVTAVDGNFISDPATLVASYKGVGEVRDLNAFVIDVPTCVGFTSHNNSVRVSWNYKNLAADGFEIYRDGDLIGQIDSLTLGFGNGPIVLGDTMVIGDNAFFDDYEGTPGTDHSYHVLAFVIRNGIKVQSGVEELFLTSTIQYPEIADVKNLTVEGLDNLGAIVISFNYEKEIVDGFEILRDGIVLDTIRDINVGEYAYQDITGVPGVEYAYSVRVYDTREGITYISTPSCISTAIYPVVPTPQNFSASQGTYPAHIIVDWDFANDAFVDSFEIQNITLGTTFQYFGGKRFHQDIVNENVVDKYRYRARALRIVEGQTKYSEWTEVTDGWSSNQQTGDESAEIPGDSRSTFNGYSVDVDGDWAVSGAPAGDESIHIYKRENGGWTLNQVIESPDANANSDFGFAVAISGGRIVVGARNVNKVWIYRLVGNAWEEDQVITSGSSRYGHSLDIDGDNLVVGAPINSTASRIFFYHLENELFVEKFEFAGTEGTSGTAYLGAATAIKGNKAFSMWGRNNVRYALEYSIAIDGTVTYIGELTSNPITTDGSEWNDNLDYDGEFLVLGDEFTGTVKVVNTTTGAAVDILPPTSEAGQDFGFSVAVTRAPSPVDDASYILVGSPGKTLNGQSDAGSAHLYSNVSGNWDLEQTLNFEDPKQDDRHGFSVAMSDDAMIYGTRNRTEVNTGAVTIDNLIDAPSLLIASDGISTDGDPDETTIYWEFDGIQDLVAGFNILRDGEMISYRSIATTFAVNTTTIAGTWNDDTGNPGQRYVYEVETVNNNIPFTSYGTADEGYSRPNGIIQGSVITAQGNVPVPGTIVNAVGFVKNEKYEYTTTSVSDGTYIIPNVYYDNAEDVITTYEKSGEFGDHLILPEGSAEVVMNSALDPVIAQKNLIDYSAYVITGSIAQPDVNCGLEGVNVYQVINGTQQLAGSAQTDANGNYALVVNPNEAGLNTLTVRVEQYREVDGDTIHYGFSALQDTMYTDFDQFPLVTELNFEDTLRYTVPIKVKNTCNDRISTAKWLVQIRTDDGCYEESFLTDTNGDLEVDLLPLNYTMKVVNVDVVSTASLKALTYFNSFPVSLDLYDLHKDSFNTLSTAEIEEASARQFTYHTAPSIEVSGFDEFFCSTPAAVAEQGETYTLSFDITEMHDTDQCAVSEGQVRITNPASAGELISFVQYDDVLEKFDDYTFVAGDPTMISPHIYAVAVDYLSVDGDYLGGTVVPVFVAGSVQLEGAAIQVDPASGNEQVPMPVMILRDPPGDGSSSYISGGQTIAWTSGYEYADDIGAEIGFEAELSALGQDWAISNTSATGQSSSFAGEYSSEVTVSQSIATSSDPSQIGRMADIVVGQGLVMSYGQALNYEIGICDTIIVSRIQTFSPTPASTDWFYTVGQIEDIIQGYVNDSISIEINQLFINLGERVLTKEESLARNNTYINNWRAVLAYHSLNTLPHYKICSEIPSITGSSFGGQLQQISNWQNALCPNLGIGSGSNFILNEEIIWTDQLMDLYNAASISIRNIANDPAALGAYSYPSNGNINTILNNPDVVAEINSYGAPMKNVTTSGGVTIEQSITNVNAGTSGITTEIYSEKSANLNFGVNIGIEVFKGALVGAGGLGVAAGLVAGTIKSVGGTSIQNDNTFTWTTTRSSSRTNTITNEVETGYTLYDDDFEDVFSVNIIQPIDQSQTAFFEFVGGQTSCPPEEGAVAIDRPQIAILDLDAGGTSDSKELYNIPLDGEAIYDIIAINATLINNNPARELEIFLDPLTNQGGASFVLNGVDLNSTNYVATFPANEPDTLRLVVTAGPIFYEYPDVVLGIKPTCSDDPVEYISVSTNFVNPCSPVSLVGPESNWVVNNDTMKLPIIMQDYDPDNNILQDARVQYRRLGQGNDWKDINPLQLEEGNYITPQELMDNDAANTLIETDQYIFLWSIPTLEEDDNPNTSFPDGEYEVRVIMKCSSFQQTISNVIRGRIARDGIKLLGTPEPADGLWTSGDEISATFDKDLDCALLGSDFITENMLITNLTTGDTIDFDLICYANKIIFDLENEMSTYDGQILKVEIQNIPSTTGNISDQLSWDFRVITRELYWNEADTINIVMYSGQSQSIIYRIESTASQTVQNITLDADDNSLAPWLAITSPVGSFSVTQSGQDVTFNITANQEVGTYIETINIEDGSNNPAQLHLRLKILNEPPGWTVDPTNFTSNMVLVANWRFNESDVFISEDISDIISVWVDGEIRGVANIEQAGEFYAAYITVYGTVDDGTDTPLEFHIWDAEEGVEYDGHPATGTEVLYTPLTTRGTIVDPEVLFVDREVDKARYIHLKQGWTGISFNTVTDDMTAQHKLRSLTHVTEGDLLVGQNQFIKYTDSLGWFEFGHAGLTTVSSDDGYMIYLESGPDTLRVTGEMVETPDLTLTSGWNWIGFPFENIEEIDSSFVVNNENMTGGPTGNDKINRNYPLDGIGLPQSAEWTFGSDGWIGSLEDMEANNMYKYYSGNPNGANLSWTSTDAYLKENSSAETARFAMSVDPSDPSTWMLPDYGSEEVMPIIAEVIISGIIQTDNADKVAFFYNDSIRAYGEITYIEEYDQYAISMIGKQITGDSIYEIKYYDASEGIVLDATNQLSFDMNGIGDVFDPYEIIFEENPCNNILILGPTGDPFVLDKTFEAQQEIIVRGSLNVPAGVNIILSAPKVTIETVLNTGNSASVTVRPDGCN